MRADKAFEYAVVRVVPRVEREEFVNAGVIVFCLERRYLEARVIVEPERIRALWPAADVEAIACHLEAIPRIAAGERDAGPIAALPLRERWHWLVSPRSTMIQTSRVHAGLCEGPERLLERLFDSLVLRAG